MAAGTVRAWSLLGRLRPSLVIGVGGYASVPVALAARLRGIPLFLQEQNSVPGRSNRLLSRLCRRVYCGFEGALPFFPPGKAVLTGNPVRREVEEAAATAPGNGPGGVFTVLALGGSQGARAINRLVLGAAALAQAQGFPVRFLLQAGEKELPSVESEAREKGLPVTPFAFSGEVSALFLSAHAVVMRAGAL
jgi:UDP-N-acetylglucosamine--N-acetylmuramyl-(pentapeptide) pyrophosphoryl-undecaprenol N-acetylglucosamine transferase